MKQLEKDRLADILGVLHRAGIAQSEPEDAVLISAEERTDILFQFCRLLSKVKLPAGAGG